MLAQVASLNWVAVLVSGFAVFMLGGIWYQAIFRQAWVKAQGFSDAQVKEMQAKLNPAVFFGGMIVCYVILAAGMAWLFGRLGVTSAASGAGLGAVLWIAPTSVLKMTDHLASGKGISAFVLDSAFQLVALVVTGAIVGGWR